MTSPVPASHQLFTKVLYVNSHISYVDGYSCTYLPWNTYPYPGSQRHLSLHTPQPWFGVSTAHACSTAKTLRHCSARVCVAVLFLLRSLSSILHSRSTSSAPDICGLAACNSARMSELQRPRTPPLSPPSTRRRHSKKKSDSLEELARTPVPSRPSSPITLPGEQEDSLLTKVRRSKSTNISIASELKTIGNPHTHTLHLLHRLAILGQPPQPSATSKLEHDGFFVPLVSHTFALAPPGTVPEPRRFNMGSRHIRAGAICLD